MLPSLSIFLPLIFLKFLKLIFYNFSDLFLTENFAAQDLDFVRDLLTMPPERSFGVIAVSTRAQWACWTP